MRTVATLEAFGRTSVFAQGAAADAVAAVSAIARQARARELSRRRGAKRVMPPRSARPAGVQDRRAPALDVRSTAAGRPMWTFVRMALRGAAPTGGLGRFDSQADAFVQDP